MFEKRPFIDLAYITVKAGNGGNGCVSFRREKYVPKGGPNGGDGGKGGDVFICGTFGLRTLFDFKKQPYYKAENGKSGGGRNKSGKSGAPLTIYVPCGTYVYKNDILLADIKTDKGKVLVAKGGKGGKGNAFFKGKKNLLRYAENGQKGEEVRIKLELKLIADVGIVGLPNAGKSTLLKRITSARPKIADYPFTTLSPNLGVTVTDKGDIIIADIPGIIEGASKGKGLGLEFLRHIERTKLLLFLIDISCKNPVEKFPILKKEIKTYSRTLLKKPYLIALNKIDISDGQEKKVKSFKDKMKKEVFPISAVTGEGIPSLLKAIETSLFR